MDRQGSGIGRGPVGSLGEAAESALQEYERNIRNRGLNHREEAVLRTGCGCQQIVSMPSPFIPVFKVTMPIPQPHTGRSISPMYTGDATYIVRRFRYDGQRDPMGRVIMNEILPYENWEEKYENLHRQVYGMDTGL